MLNLAAPPELIGRARELSKALKALEKSARSGAPAIVRIVGDAGIGKTLFTEHFAAQAQHEGWLVLSTTCHELQRNTPFIAATRLILSFLQQMPDAESYVSGLETGLAALDSAIALRLAQAPSPTPSKGRYLEIFSRFFDGVGSDYKVFLFCDDAQWSDPDSREIIEALAAGYVVGPLAVVYASRPVQEGDTALAGSTHIVLNPLAKREARALARARFPGISEVALDAVVEHGKGIPFEIIALGEEFEEGHAISREAGEHRVQDLISNRTNALRPLEREFLQTCSLLGEPIEYRLLFALYEPSDVAKLVSGVGRPYLMAEGAALRFRHALVADAIRNTVEFDVPLRRRIINVLCELTDKTFSDYQRITNHARAIGDMRLAHEQYSGLARAAFTAKAWTTVVSASESALACGDVAPSEFVMFYMRYSRALRRKNEDSRAKVVLEQALQEGARLPLKRGMGTLLSLLMGVLWAQGRRRDAIATFEAQRYLLTDPADLAEIAALAMRMHAYTYNEEEFEKYRRAFNALGPGATPYSVASCYGSEALWNSMHGDYASALEKIEAATVVADLERRQDDNLLFGRILIQFREHGCVAGDALDSWIEANMVDEREHDFANAFRAWIAAMRGDWALAGEVSERSLLAGVTSAAELLHVTLHTMIAALRREVPQWLPVHWRSVQASLLDWQTSDAILQFGPWFLLNSREQKFDQELGAALMQLPGCPPEPFSIGFVPLGIALAGIHLQQKHLLRLFVDHSETKDRSRWTQMQWSIARGVALKALDDPRADPTLREASQAASDLGATFLSAYTALRGGFASRSDVERLQSLRIAESSRKAKAAHGLTARELEVARLVGEGKTNRGIAEQLFLSERTVERHLGNIFTKLAIDSRIQLMRWLYESNL